MTNINKWQMHRAGFLNFWYYDQEDYFFSDGKLLLRGLNGSGKSVTMQSLITVLLDGKIAANRLDPFGSKDRRMEDYLLGEKDVVDRDERTGYLYLEYKRKHTEQYLTTGIGLKAKRGGNLDFWGFIITDNRRINHELFLAKTEYNADGKPELIPLTRAELERAIGPQGGFVVRSQSEYAALVNKYVFGFTSVESYKDLMELLIQLRSPKLSKDFRPSVIHEILTNSLPALSDEELRPLSDTIENMEQTKEQIAMLERDQAALGRLSRYYDQYNIFVLAEKAQKKLRTDKALAKLERIYLERTKEKTAKAEELIQELDNKAAYDRELTARQKEKEELDTHDVFKAEKQKHATETAINLLQQKYRDKSETLAGKKQAEQREKATLKQQQETLDQAEIEMLEVLEELAALAEEADFAAHAEIAANFEKNYSQQYSFDVWKAEAAAHHRRLNSIVDQFRSQAAAKREQQAAALAAEQAQQAFDTAREQARHAEQIFFTQREELLARVYEWITHSKEILPVEPEEISQIAQAIQRLYEDTAWQEVIRPAEAAFKRQENIWRKQELELTLKTEQKKAERRNLEAELQSWKIKKDPEPVRHQDTFKARETLTSLEIPFLPFYAAVEFNSNVSSQERERIESVLAEIGLLDALVVPRKAVDRLPDELFDRVIHPEPAIMCATLADYLHPTPPAGQQVSAADIDDVLRSIIVNEADNTLLTASGPAPVVSVRYGSYRSGLIAGQAPVRDTALYIGQEARRQYRLQEIARLEAALATCGQELASLTAEHNHVLDKITELEACLAGFPTAQILEAAYQAWQNSLREVKILEADANRKNAALRESLNKVQALTNQLRQLASGLKLPLAESAYAAASQQAEEYRSQLHALELACRNFINSRKNVELTQKRLSELQTDVDELKGECLLLSEELAKLDLELKNINARLAALGAEDIRRRSQEVVARLAELPALIEKAVNTIASLRAEINNLENQITLLEHERSFTRQLCECWRQVFAEEAALRLVGQTDDETQKLSDAETVVSTYASVLETPELDRDKVGTRLTESYYKENTLLMEYRLQLDEILVDSVQPPNIPPVEDQEFFNRHISELKQITRRKRVTLEYDGRRMTPQAALQLIDKQIADQKAILSQQDRELYEEVIMNSIGRIISKRINSAENWVAQMNDLMESLDTSSGLAFSLQWKPLTADDDNQLDTEELVKLLRADHRLLKEEDMKRVVRHFQSRIEQAKTQAASRSDSFQHIVRELLDFRKWFAFTLFYRREGMPKKELTNNAFGKFSGGEKAMAMYIPLFSAACSRYREARADAPRIISLDEAFAGVDENNIREMFDLVEKLEFNYIMNSQALWGDYDTVSQLSIYELVRPKNAPYVSLVRYHWDGHARRLLYDEVS
ncbi:hypothetical protein SCACP_11030 [Sporomusa carbonis]